MDILTADMKAIIQETNLGFVATTNLDGSPSLSPKASLRVHDGDHLLFADISSPGTVTNLANDPRIEINCISIFARRGYRFKGTATVHSTGTGLCEDLEASVKQEHGDCVPVHHAILVKIDVATPLLSPAYMFYDNVNEDELRSAYKQKYGVAPHSSEGSH